MALVKLKLTKKNITGKLEISNLSEKMLELNMRPMFTDSQVPRKGKKTTHKIDKQLFFFVCLIEVEMLSASIYVLLFRFFFFLVRCCVSFEYKNRKLMPKTDTRAEPKQCLQITRLKRLILIAPAFTLAIFIGFCFRHSEVVAIICHILAEWRQTPNASA